MDYSSKEIKTRDYALGFAIYIDYRGRADGPFESVVKGPVELTKSEIIRNTALRGVSAFSRITLGIFNFIRSSSGKRPSKLRSKQ